MSIYCPICLEHITNRQQTSCCKQDIHKDCLQRWISISNTCPICRKCIIEEEEDIESQIHIVESDANASLSQTNHIRPTLNNVNHEYIKRIICCFASVFIIILIIVIVIYKS